MEITREWARASLIKFTCKYESICEKLRTIYDLVYDMPESELKRQMTDLLVDALYMGKKMQDRMQYYQEKYGDDSGRKGGLKEIPDFVDRQIKRVIRQI